MTAEASTLSKKIEGKNITYRYDDGKVETNDIEGKARIYKNMIGEQRRVHPYQTPGYFQTLGRLARHGEFTAEVPPASREIFEDNYEAATGQKAVVGKNGYSPVEVQKADDKWGSELRVNMPDDKKLELPPGVELRTGYAPGKVRVNNNQFWWRLVRMGFRLGTHHDVAQIRENVPAANRSEFDEGYKD